VRTKTGGRGVDVILDLVGGGYLGENLKSLALKGRLMLVGLTAGRKAELDLGMTLSKRLTLVGTVLRARPFEEKAAAIAEFEAEVVPMLAEGKVKPNVDRVFDLDQVRDAHDYLESNESFGKVVLKIAD
jgi:NADPH:quinone reductase